MLEPPQNQREGKTLKLGGGQGVLEPRGDPKIRGRERPQSWGGQDVGWGGCRERGRPLHLLVVTELPINFGWQLNYFAPATRRGLICQGKKKKINKINKNAERERGIL